ncbi:MAG: DinB family protein [Saprospiraceae bacterium]|nr:DinB family protein [Saprospiraceae bacterium]
MKHIAQTLLEVIETARPRLLSIDAAAAASKPVPEKWSPKEVLGHLIDSAANNHQRFVRAQLDITDLSAYRYEQDRWVNVQQYRQAEWQSLISLWYYYNRHLAHVIGSIDRENAERQVAAFEEASTLRFVAEDYVRHLNHHLTQIFQST